MRVLVACEESQRVCQAFRDKGHGAYSCDLLQTSGDHPEWHIQGNIIDVIAHSHRYGNQPYFPLNSDTWKWDLLIAFPPCDHLAVSGARWFPEKRADGRQQKAIDFFMQCVNFDIPHICIENPIGIMSTMYRKPDQIIQPWQFGHGETKSTCLWLKGLPKLIPTDIVPGREQRVHRMSPGPNRARDRARTYPGIAEAMAIQWSDLK